MCAFHRTELIFYETGYLDDKESNLKFNVTFHVWTCKSCGR